MPSGVICATGIIAKDYLRTGIAGEASVADELGNVLDILVAAAQLVLAAGVVDADEEGLLPDHGESETGQDFGEDNLIPKCSRTGD